MYKLNNITIVIIVLYFILRTYGILELLPGLWVFPLAFIIIQSIHIVLNQQPKVTKFLFKESRWIVLSFFILLTYVSFQYGNFKLETTFTYLLTSIPFYIIGFSNGIKLNDSFLKKTTVSYFLFLSIYILPKTVTVLSSGSFNSDLFISLFVSSKEDTSVIFFLPFVAFITIYGFKLLFESKKSAIVNTIAALILFLNILALFISSKAGPIAVIVFAIIIYYFKGERRKIKKYSYILVSSLSILLFVFGLASGFFGELGSLKAKSSAFIRFVDSGFLFNDEILNNITSDRWTTDVYSLKQFLNKPLYGNGAYLETVEGMLGDAKSFTTAAGGHSFVLDTMAYYGIFGLPIILILFKFAKDGFRYFEVIKSNKFESKKVLLYASLVSSVFITNILNTGFLFSTFDNFLFLLAGFYLGKYYRIRKKQLFNGISLSSRSV
tara:strand:- start:11268 stop:12578 length:1311 start_codon:yes stop_codon:yes gene_type:complete